MGSTALNKIIEEFSHLPMNDKEYAIDMIKKQLIEAKREALVKRAKEAIGNLKNGMTKKGSVKELFKDLESD